MVSSSGFESDADAAETLAAGSDNGDGERRERETVVVEERPLRAGWFEMDDDGGSSWSVDSSVSEVSVFTAVVVLEVVLEVAAESCESIGVEGG